MGIFKRRAFLYLLILIAIVAVVIAFLPRGDGVPTGDIGDVAALARGETVTVEGKTITPSGVVKIEHNDSSIKVYDADGETKLLKCKYSVQSSEDLKNALISRDVTIADYSEVLNNIEYNPPSGFNWGSILITLLPVLLLFGLLFFLLRGAQGASNQAFNFPLTSVHCIQDTTQDMAVYFQYKELFEKAQNKKILGIALALIGSGMIIGGISVVNAKFRRWTEGDHEPANGAGVFLILTGSAGLGVGIPTAIIGARRKSQYRKLMERYEPQATLSIKSTANGLGIVYNF